MGATEGIFVFENCTSTKTRSVDLFPLLFSFYPEYCVLRRRAVKKRRICMNDSLFINSVSGP